MEKLKIGKVTHYFSKIGVAVLQLDDALKVGDKVYIESGEPFEQLVTSMQVNHKNIEAAKKGDDVAMKVDGKVHEGNVVYKVAG